MIFQGGKGNSAEAPRNLTSGDQIGDHYKIETAIDEVEGSVARVYGAQQLREERRSLER